MTEKSFFKDYKLSDIDLENPKNSHDFQILLTGKNKKVLEIGTASGYITKILKKHGCRITGIEENPDFAASAKEFTEKMIMGDVESLDLTFHLKDEKFDVILLGDIIEHLKSPEVFLKKLHPFLNENGYLVCSIPNISYILIRLQLLNGNFDYTNTGLLDDDHLKYFTLKTITLLLDKTDFKFETLHRVKEEFYLPHRSDLDKSLFPQILIECIQKDPESLTYQYVFSAIPFINNEKSSIVFTDDKESIPTFHLKKILDDKFSTVDDYTNALDEIKRKKGIIEYLENALKDKDAYLENALKDKDAYLENALKDKDAYLEDALNTKEIRLAKIIFILPIGLARIFDKLLRKNKNN